MAGPTLRLNLDAMGVKQGARDVNAAFDKIKTKATETEVAVKKSGSAISRMGQMSGQTRFIFNNTANQLGDIAVQASMGTDMFRILGFQLPQIAGGFALLGGPIGIVASALGVVAAVGFPLAAMFSNMGRSADETSDDVRELSDVLQSFNALQKATAADITAYLTKSFGDSANAVQMLVQELRDAEFNEFMKPVRDGLDDVTIGIDKLQIAYKTNKTFDQMRKDGQMLSTVQQAIKDDNDELILNNLVLALRMNEVGSALDRIGTAATSNEFIKFTSDAIALLDEFPLSSIAKQAREDLINMATEMGVLDQVTNDAAGTMDELADAAERARKNMQFGLGLGMGVNPFGGQGRDVVAGDIGIDAFGGAGDFKYDLPTSYTEGSKLFTKAQNDQEAAAQKAANALKAQQNEYKRIVDKFKPAITAAQAYDKAIQDINKAVAIKAVTEEQGAIATAEATRRYKIATGELADYDAVANTFAKGLEDSMLSLVDGTMSVQDAFKSMASAVIKELFRVLVVQQMVNAAMGVFGYSPAAGGGYVKTGVGAYGGEAQAGNAMIVGEKGPELFIPQTSGQIVPNSGMGGDVIVQQTINVTTGVQQTVRNEIRTLLPQIAESAKGAVLDAKRRGGNYRKAFA